MFNKIITILILLLPFHSYSIVGGTTFTVTNTNDSGAGSLRDAVTRFNESHHKDDEIEFKIPGNGPLQINLLSDIEINRREGALYSLTHEVNIYGKGLLKTKYPSVILIGINRIQQPKSLREMALKIVAQQITSGKISEDFASQRLVSKLHEPLKEEIADLECQLTLESIKRFSKLGSWDILASRYLTDVSV